MKEVSLALAGLLVASAAFAQEQAPVRGKATATIGGKAVMVDYGQAKLKGRSFDELLKGLGPDRMWRTGENQVTTIETAGPLLVGGKAVPAGKYSMYVHMGEGDTNSLVLNKNLGIPLIKIWAQAPANLANEPWPALNGYEHVASEELIRVTLAKASNPKAVDPFAITLTPKGAGATLTLAWGDKSFSTEIAAGK
ncbi:MAG: DUF2911 domain-containing protein [Vicinamibacteria bacterium]